MQEFLGDPRGQAVRGWAREMVLTGWQWLALGVVAPEELGRLRQADALETQAGDSAREDSGLRVTQQDSEAADSCGERRAESDTRGG